MSSQARVHTCIAGPALGPRLWKRLSRARSSGRGLRPESAYLLEFQGSTSVLQASEGALCSVDLGVLAHHPTLTLPSSSLRELGRSKRLAWQDLRFMNKMPLIHIMTWIALLLTVLSVRCRT